jgi:hypothetical protein
MARTHFTTPTKISIRQVTNLQSSVCKFGRQITKGWLYSRESWWFWPIVLTLIVLGLVGISIWIGLITIAMLTSDFNSTLFNIIAGVIASMITVLILKNHVRSIYLNEARLSQML